MRFRGPLHAAEQEGLRARGAGARSARGMGLGVFGGSLWDVSAWILDYGPRDPARCLDCRVRGPSHAPSPRAGLAKECEEDQFRCQNGRCIPSVWRCDEDDDCSDNSDEDDCPKKTCMDTDFTCDNGHCIPERWKCDGEEECSDGSDEFQATCPKQVCPAEKLSCGPTSHKCVPASWRCDGEKDCESGADEAGCATSLGTCRADEFQCGDGACVPAVKRCNQEQDCPDGSDEAGCLTESTCEGPRRFQCKSGECVDGGKVCDSQRDCRDWSDEPLKECGLNECLHNNGGCSHICNDLKIGFECTCPAGYRLLDQKTCGDIDECEDPDACSQICVNYKGYFKCECHPGYEMDTLTKNCKAVAGRSPSLIFTNRHEVRRIDLVKRDYSRLIPMLKNVVALDVEVATNRIYWCDLSYRKIYSAYMDKASDPAEQEVLIDEQLHSPEGLAVDWVHKHIYWTDSGNKTISVATVDGSRRRTLFSHDLSEPRAIAVDPLRGFMYWSDWGYQAKIEKSGLNGADRHTLVSDDIEWPNGITLDLLSQRLYWVDSKLHQLSSIDFSGGHRKMLISSPHFLGHPFGVAVFEDKVFWTDLENEAIFSANRLTGLEISVLAENLNNPHDIVIFHELKQPRAGDACELSAQPSGGCEYLCLPAPQLSSHSPKYTCACPDTMWLGPDMKRCYRAPQSTSTTTLASTTVRPEADSARAPGTAIHSPTHQNHSTETPRLAAAAPSSVSVPRASSIGPSTPSPATSNHSQHYGNEGGKTGSTVTAAVIGIVVPMAVIALLCMSGYLIWRNWKRKNTKSMNFDNPVYRKTTEEEDEDELHIGRAAQIGHVYPAAISSFDRPLWAEPCLGETRELEDPAPALKELLVLPGEPRSQLHQLPKNPLSELPVVKCKRVALSLEDDGLP
ncbi:PREDICTED: low-density lipoprotein receptor-related protein 8 [Myotis brandtii]|uniref:low-density lipoprotein receptor-related protein 8 n=1 Tax=Myotis brandtii TaxID=109478 RepID=UPI0003BBF95E|nr:PREDICTED: low-density lipoprotein receptor-related protein 8 [Myotis brandtii]